MGDEGVALESIFRDGVKNEALRSLCQLVNTSELALEVCVVELAESDWQMLPWQARSISSGPDVAPAVPGWEWDSPWEVELSPYVDKEGWAYAPDWAAMDWPPQNGAQKRGVVDFTRRRRWLRRRRQDLTRSSPPPQEAPAPSPRQSPAARRTTLIRAIAAENSKKEVHRTLLGTVQPGDSIAVPYGWQKAGVTYLLQLVLTAQTGVQ
ncbi:TPA: hypothetical protein ACH3X2_003177 [Trebouxia sp. C0005]